MKLLCNECFFDRQQIDSTGKIGCLDGVFLYNGKLWCELHYVRLSRKEGIKCG